MTGRVSGINKKNLVSKQTFEGRGNERRGREQEKIAHTLTTEPFDPSTFSSCFLSSLMLETRATCHALFDLVGHHASVDSFIKAMAFIMDI